jgi:hypothetical protein
MAQARRAWLYLRRITTASTKSAVPLKEEPDWIKEARKYIEEQDK